MPRAARPRPANCSALSINAAGSGQRSCRAAGRTGLGHALGVIYRIGTVDCALCCGGKLGEVAGTEVEVRWHTALALPQTKFAPGQVQYEPPVPPPPALPVWTEAAC